MESEAQTRKKRIDTKLRDAGWKIVPFMDGGNLGELSHHAVEEFPTVNGPADYALVSSGQILGVIEAKKVTVSAKGVLVQAERYSKGVTDSPFNFDGYRVPLLYSTNGEIIYFHDIRYPLNTSRKIAHFHTPGALSEMFASSVAENSEWFTQNPNDHPKLRAYQRDANTAVEAAIRKGKRQMLVAMATGTGKTFTTVNQTYRLLKSGTACRVLFLVDRRALAAQAVRAFAAFEPEPNLKFDRIYEVYSNRFQKEDFGEEDAFDAKVMPNDYLTHPQPKHVFVYVCTIQRMAISILGRGAVFEGDGDDLDEDAEQLPIPIHAFDAIIADECHRGYTSSEQSVWRSVLDHFDAFRIGLTATPASHTTSYFNEVVFRYTYDEAVRDGHLVDWDLVKIKSDVRIHGVFLKEGETVAQVDTQTGIEQLDTLEDERDFDITDVERRVTSPDSNRKILQELKKYTDEHEKRYNRFPKTLIFAANDLPHTSHADELVSLAVDIFERGEAFVRKITGRVDRPLQRIREFRNRPNPGIVVTVDLLSTGVDIPDLEYIVFLRPVKSRILFEQMLGRGTRRGEQHPDKSHFTVFDCFDGTLVEFFRQTTSMTTEPPAKPTRTIVEIIKDIWDNRDRDYNIRCLVKRLQRIDKEMSSEARDDFEAFGIPDGDLNKYASGLSARLKKDFTENMKLLRDEQFQKLLDEYKRKEKVFLRAIEYADTVSSTYLVREGGIEYKPEDYLAMFERFVRDNPEHIEAIRILLERPAGWSTAALKELKNKLTTSTPRFTIENLQKAHHLRYDKALVDIISMVKHAASEQNPLLTAAERAARAIEQISHGQEYTAEQQQWLHRIEQHLAQNLSIDEEDFEYIPALEGAGGWGRANRVFNGKLKELLQQLNAALAA
ncbi:MAG TPA: type I restriction-modification enzyme R subunit C-terminal domain-containing protein [Pirellulaceae bacterium]|nr:type I restriction-modification enzyme R subunit C-terminal domain-containing protein [Pirellulaceae bacterium]HMO94338.1 type I restriction-modification enzyme R subunit C-terminal domain-containing protein [Pirellulaceae bacterium]HMP69649.1 type I restriction-modification enzyme R subunit C-terminal domain-containing protein [Pirellulaceae bacterium]